MDSNKLEILRWMVLLLYLLMNAVSDLKYHLIMNRSCIIAGIAGSILFIYDWNHGNQMNGLVWIIGVGMILLSIVTKQAIGMGDGIIVLIMGLWIGVYNLLAIGMLALGIAGGYAFILLCVCKKNRKYEIPFIPFLWISAMIVRCIQVVGI